MNRIVLAFLALLTVAAPAAAAVVRECDAKASITNLVEPWEKYTKTFYSGKVRVALIDTGGEPACCAEHLAIVFADNSAEGGNACFLVSQTNELGFHDVGIEKIAGSYDPKKGLLLTFPFTLNNGEGDRPGIVKVRVNIGHGTATIEK